MFFSLWNHNTCKFIVWLIPIEDMKKRFSNPSKLSICWCDYYYTMTLLVAVLLTEAVRNTIGVIIFTNHSQRSQNRHYTWCAKRHIRHKGCKHKNSIHKYCNTLFRKIFNYPSHDYRPNSVWNFDLVESDFSSHAPKWAQNFVMKARTCQFNCD